MGWWLVWTQTEAGGPRVGVAIYALSVSALFGASGFLHVPHWPPRLRLILRKVDHCLIFVLIAGKFCLLFCLSIGLIFPFLFKIECLIIPLLFKTIQERTLQSLAF